MSKPVFVIIVLAIVLTGCSSNIEKISNEYETEMNDLTSSYKLELEQLEQNYQGQTTDLKSLIEEQESKISILQNEKDEISKSNQLTSQIKQTNELEFEKYRFVLDGIYSEEEAKPYFNSDIESIDGIALGSNMSNILKTLGYGFELIISDDGYDPNMNYNGLYISVHPTNYHVTGIYVNTKGHESNEGIQVGDNAKEVISKYDEKYEMNVNEVLLPEYTELTFKLEEEIFIKFDIDTETVQDDSKITAIRVFKLGYPEY